jgi:hypothetical protein
MAVSPSLPQHFDPVGAGLTDQKLFDKGSDLEQPSDFASHSAQREFALPFFCHGPIGKKEDVKAGAGDVSDVFQVDHDRGSAGMDKRN